MRGAYYTFKSLHGRHYRELFGIAWNAFVSYTKAFENDNQILMLQEIIFLMELTEDTPDEFPISDKQFADYYQTLGNLYKKRSEDHSALECFMKCLEVRK